MTLVETCLLGTVFGQVLLTLALYLRLSSIRLPATKKGEVDLEAAALNNSVWSEASRKTSNAIGNQFELPVLFYLAGVLALLLHAASWPLVALGALFVAFRIGHAIEHVGRNDVNIRFNWFLCSFVVNCLIWAWLAAELFLFGSI